MIHCVFRLSFLSLSRTSLCPLTVTPYSRPSGSCPSCSPFCTSSPECWSRPSVESGYEASHRGASICQRSPSIHPQKGAWMWVGTSSVGYEDDLARSIFGGSVLLCPFLSVSMLSWDEHLCSAYMLSAMVLFTLCPRREDQEHQTEAVSQNNFFHV